MVEPNLPISPILRDRESSRRLCFKSDKKFVYCGKFRRRQLPDCLLFSVLVLRLSGCHLCVSKRPRAANTRSDRAQKGVSPHRIQVSSPICARPTLLGVVLPNFCSESSNLFDLYRQLGRDDEEESMCAPAPPTARIGNRERHRW